MKDKKIAVFNALPHHGRFIFPLVEDAARRGAEILFFTTLVDYPFEKDVIKRGFKCRFLIEYADEETRDKIRRSTAMLLDEWSKLNFSWHGFRHWSLFQQNRSLIRNVEDYFCLEELIKKEKPDMFLSLHEMNPWGKQIGHLAYKYAIPFVTLQEGDYYNALLNLSTHTEYSTLNLLWGEEARNMLLRHKCCYTKMVIVGNTYIDESINACASPEAVLEVRRELAIPARKKVVTFMPNTHWGGITERTVWATLLKDLKRKDVFCIFKWHPQTAYPIYEQIKKVIRSILPDALVLFGYDPYKVLAVSDYCVVMGKTTMGVEALAYGKPLFELYNIVNGEEYYVELGVAQSVSPAGNWKNLFDTFERGVPEEILETAARYIERVFYRLDGKSSERAADVLEFVFEARAQSNIPAAPFAFKHTAVEGRVSCIIPSGDDHNALLATLVSLSKNLKHPDVEYLIVLTCPELREMLAGLDGNVRIIESSGDNYAGNLNAAARETSGSRLLFVEPGVIYYRDEGFLEAITGGVAGIPTANNDMTPLALGVGFDFNHAPCNVRANGKTPPFCPRSALVGIDRGVFERLGGFAEDIDYHLADFCLAAHESGYPLRIADKALAIQFKKVKLNPPGGYFFHDGRWKRGIRFFAKWCGKLPKDDDYITFAKDMLA
jgi:hypothetical protein